MMPRYTRSGLTSARSRLAEVRIGLVLLGVLFWVGSALPLGAQSRPIAGPETAAESGAQTSAPSFVGSPDSAPAIATLEALLDQLGDPDFQIRERATEAIIAQGEAVVDVARQRLDTAADPEVRYRLRYILDNIAAPAQAVLIVRATPDCGLRPGDVVTHVNGRRVRVADGLRRAMQNETHAVLRVRGGGGPRDVDSIGRTDLITIANYQAPDGEIIASVLRLYADGYVEKAHARLADLPEAVPENELSTALRAIIAFTAGEGRTALAQLTPLAELVKPMRDGNTEWASPSPLDLCGPFKAPYHVEWVLWGQARDDADFGFGDPDLRVQRVLVRAARPVDALRISAQLWSQRFRALLENEAPRNVAGNLLAVCAWMFHELELSSECQRLIAPRSEILANSNSGTRKWVRVETDSWLPFLAGNVPGAIDALYADARDILVPRDAAPRNALIRNPQVAAQIAFFLYQQPNDPRVADLLALVTQPGCPALAEYARWMLYGLTPANREEVQRDLGVILRQVNGVEAAELARALVILEYARPQPERTVMDSARERLTEAESREERDYWRAVVDALETLAAGRGADARRALASFDRGWGLAVLRHTAEFESLAAGGIANQPALQAPLAAVPLGTSGDEWIVLTREQRLVRFDARTGTMTPLERPSSTWAAGAVNWPWLGRDESSGRVWVYDRRRVVEVGVPAKEALRLSLKPEQIEAFEEHAGPVFVALADAVKKTPLEEGERGAFLRSEIKANGEFVADPALPELALIAPLAEDPRVVQIALRGGPHLLVRKDRPQVITSLEIANQLGSKGALRFSAQAVPEQASPLVFLMSDEGLLKLDFATGRVNRLALPGLDPAPPVVPESTPYVRRDPRWVYFARLPRDGGQVYRVVLAENRVEPVDLINEALPPDYYRLRSRVDVRREVDEALQEIGIANRDALIDDSIAAVKLWLSTKAPN